MFRAFLMRENSSSDQENHSFIQKFKKLKTDFLVLLEFDTKLIDKLTNTLHLLPYCRHQGTRKSEGPQDAPFLSNVKKLSQISLLIA